MNAIEKAYRFLNLLSIDIAIGAIACGVYFAWVLDVHVRPYALASLGITVWIIYTADHLLDAWKVNGRASTERHRFHQDHFRILVVLVTIAILIDFILIFFIKRPVLFAGLYMIALVVVYLLFHNKLTFLKEFFVALLYCVGVLLPSLTVTDVSLEMKHHILFISFFLLALINLLLFSLFDKKDDEKDKRQSFVTLSGERATRWIIIVLSSANMLLLSYLFFKWNETLVVIIPFLMNTALIIIMIFNRWFEKNSRYRLLGDAIFLLPLLYLAGEMPY
jgi:4-hydroxybenzoate polyprenyltransferase